MDENVNNSVSEKEQDNVVSIWAFLGLQLLYSIPCVGIICLIVFACGAIKNKNIKNHARAMLIIIGVVIAIYLLLFFLGIGAGIFSASKSAINSSLY